MHERLVAHQGLSLGCVVRFDGVAKDHRGEYGLSVLAPTSSENVAIEATIFADEQSLVTEIWLQPDPFLTPAFRHMKHERRNQDSLLRVPNSAPQQTSCQHVWNLVGAMRNKTAVRGNRQFELRYVYESA